MAAPYPILIKKTNNSGVTTATINSEEEFHMVVSEIPFHFVGDVKEPYSNDWKDEDGVEEYLPDEGLRLSAYDMDVTFLYNGAFNSFAGNLRNFLDYLLGTQTDGNGNHIDNGCRLTIYDTYNAVGRQDVRVKKIDPDVFVKQNVSQGTNQEIAKFKITFRVGDPVTDIPYSDMTGE